MSVSAVKITGPVMVTSLFDAEIVVMVPPSLIAVAAFKLIDCISVPIFPAISIVPSSAPALVPDWNSIVSVEVPLSTPIIFPTILRVLSAKEKILAAPVVLNPVVDELPAVIVKSSSVLILIFASEVTFPTAVMAVAPPKLNSVSLKSIEAVAALPIFAAPVTPAAPVLPVLPAP